MTASPKRERAWLLPVLMIAGSVAGLVLGGVVGARWTEPGWEPLAMPVRLLGTLFLAMLKGLVIPLVITSVITGVTGMGDIRKVRGVVGWTALYIVTTTFFAVLTGLALVTLIAPGEGANGAAIAAAPPISEAARHASQSPLQAVFDVLASMVPSNVFEAASSGNVLGLIVFSLVFGASLSALGPRGRPLVAALEGANEALLRLVRVVVWLAPLGILGLVADRIGKAGGGAAVWDELRRLGGYALTVLLGLTLHAAVTLPVLLRVLARRDPLRYLAGMADALLTAFGTASSAAAMPITMRCVTKKNGVSARAADIVIPLGTTVNMDGTALYEAVAVMFVAQTTGAHLGFGQQVALVLTATLAAIGAAAIPEAGLVTMVLVLGAVGLPAESVGLLVSIDWVLDRFRTAVNVWGDSVGAAIIERRLPPETEEATGPPDEPAPPSGEVERAVP